MSEIVDNLRYTIISLTLTYLAVHYMPKSMWTEYGQQPNVVPILMWYYEKEWAADSIDISASLLTSKPPHSVESFCLLNTCLNV